MQANKGSIIATIIICAVLLGGLIYFVQPDEVTIPEFPTAAEIADLIVIPTTQEIDSDLLEEILDQVDTRTDVSRRDKRVASNYATDELSDRDFKELLEDIVDIDEEDFEVLDVDVKDTEVTTVSEDDNEDGNFLVERFIRVEYQDNDENEAEVVYVVLTANIIDLDDNDNDQDVEYSIEEVTRSFELD